jgi:hypothetical protein
MIWSFTAHRTFRKCQRQWYYKHIFASSLAKDPERRKAALLGKLESIQAWRGKIVDTVISQDILPSISWRAPRNLDYSLQRARTLFDEQRHTRTVFRNNGPQGFFEIEYGKDIPEDKFQRAWNDVEHSLRNFYANGELWCFLRGSTRLIAQRPLIFTHGDASVRVVPDAIAFHDQQAPTIIDWKVNNYQSRDYSLQLATGILGVARCKSHKDFPPNGHPPETGQLLEVQLLPNEIRRHPISVDILRDAENLISCSAHEMSLAIADDTKLEDFPVTNDPNVCQQCPFRKMCWGHA